LMRLKSDLLELLLRATDGTLDQVELQWDRRFALGVVMAASGYPQAPRTGDAIQGLPAVGSGHGARVGDTDAHVFHAGTTLGADGVVRTSGGRVLCVTALGDSARQAQQHAYEALSPIHFECAQWRRDIGHRALKANR
ncbi:MAG: phosphoribosylglycinamide synthetase C domain-containing protein, partial [Rubrivivax sp.]